MKYIAIQAGHDQIKNNCVASLRGGTGAPQEAETNKRIALRLEQILQQNGFKTIYLDANYNCDPNSDKTDYDLFISLHCDANYAGDEGGGFVDFPEPETDYATAESQRIAKAIGDVYFQESGIRNVPSRSNANTRYYYMWASLSSKTPCVLLEMGESVDAHDRVILNDTERVAQAIAKGIFKAFPSETPQPPTDPCANIKKELETIKKDHEKCSMLIQEISSLKASLLSAQAEIKDKTERLNQVSAERDRLREKISKAQVALS